jgi:hypothetical protein
MDPSELYESSLNWTGKELPPASEQLPSDEQLSSNAAVGAT